MLSLLKHRIVVVGAGFVLLAAVIWYVGPLIPIARYKPLAPVLPRAIAIALLAIAFAAGELIARRRARRADDRLAAALVEQGRRDDRPSADVLRLREQFESAVATLTQSATGGGQGLYDLPWYVFIGAPGSGKTTALLHSGLRFPVEPRDGRGAVQGIGGTRNCDWWFTDEAVFLDTAGRYTTQDSDGSADSAGWREFLTLLRTHRGRRPINGIILTVSAKDLIEQTPEDRQIYVEAARRRLQEIQRDLRVQLPVYLMVTKCDLVAGFAEYFDDLDREGRAQVWGVTFPYEQSRAGEAARQLPAEFDRLVQRLNERLLWRVSEERDVRRRARLFAFPQQLAGVRDALLQFTNDVFAATRFDAPILLRGVYFTSGTQEGTPIDRLLGALGRRFAVAADAIAPPPGRGKAYFIERLLREVVLGESGLAGVNRRVELRNAALQLGAYAALGLVALLAVVLLTVSYGRNRTYLAAVAAEVERLQEVPPLPPSAPIGAVADRLDALRALVAVAERHDADRPWAMRWGLFQGNAIGGAARDAYVRELNTLLLPRVVGRIEQQLNAFIEPELLYEYLKAYLMLGGEGPVDPRFLSALAAEGREADDRLVGHFASLVGDGTRLRPVRIDETLVRQGRRAIQSASIPHLAYRAIVRHYADDTRRAVRLDADEAQVARVLRRRSGASLSDPQPSLYSREVFEEVTSTSDLAGLAEDYASEHWVWGDGGAPSISSAELQAEVLRLYEDDYIRHWDALVTDVTVAPLRGPEVADGLAILSGPTSPLRIFYETVRDHTRLVVPAATAEGDSGSSFRDRATRFGRDLLGGGDTAPAVVPGQRITDHFAPVHALVEGTGGTAPIDRVLGEIRQIQQTLAATGSGLGQGPTDARTQVTVQSGVRALNEGVATLPPPFRSVVRQVGDVAESTVAGGARMRILDLYQQMVVSECTMLGASRYPLARHPTQDMLLDDFATLFGPEGVFERFFTQVLAEYVDVSARPWQWRAGAGLGIPADLPRQFERAREIREAFFRGGGRAPRESFTLTSVRLDDEVRRFRLMAGERLVVEDVHGPERSAVLAWPGDAGPVVATFEDGSSVAPHLEYEGDWAWFRMLETGELTRERADRYLLLLRSNGRQATLRVDMPSVVNALERRDRVRDFPCDAS